MIHLPMKTQQHFCFNSAFGKVVIRIFLILVTVAFINSCKDDDDDPVPVPTADEALFDEVTASGYTFYQGGNILPADSASPHGSFKLRLNATAQAALDSTGELPTGGTFPTGSILVKEVYNGTTLSLYAVMKKDPSNTNSGQGWLWAEYDTDGATNFSVLNKGNNCTSCHSSTPNRDLVRTFDFH